MLIFRGLHVHLSKILRDFSLKCWKLWKDFLLHKIMKKSYKNYFEKIIRLILSFLWRYLEDLISNNIKHINGNYIDYAYYSYL